MRYAVLTTPRCGSTLFCDLLHSSGLVGMPDKYNQVLFVGSGELADAANLERVMSDIDQGGYAGIKLAFDYLDNLYSPTVSEFLRTIDAYIVLDRMYYVAQAISWSLAEQTGRWHSHDTPVNDEPHFDYEDIAYKVATIRGANERYACWLEEIQKPYVLLGYDHWIENPDEHIRNVIKWLGVSAPNSVTFSSDLQKLEDPRKAEWEKRYLKEYNERHSNYLAGEFGDLARHVTTDL
jgi:trehalose 2-sulfotransferase